MRSSASAKRSSGVNFSRFLMIGLPLGEGSALGVDAARLDELGGSGGDLLDANGRNRSGTAGRQTETGDVIERRDTVTPRDLLPLIVVAAGVRDRLLVD